MARLRLYPHRTADDDCVRWHKWWTERDGARSTLPQLLAGWDYASDVVVGISVDINKSLLLDSTGLADLQELEVLLMADCPLAQQRFVTHAPLSTHDHSTSLDVTLQLPPGQAAGVARLSAHVVLARTTAERDDRVAHLRGARLHSSEPFNLRLEGDSGRFPTEPVSFSELGYGNAPWTVLSMYEDLSDSFMGGIRLLINTDHPVGLLSLEPQSAARVGGLLRVEVMRLLIAQVAGKVEQADSSAFEEGSVGQVLGSMCELFLKCGLATAARLYREDPARFELLLHDRVDPLSGVTA